MNCDCDNTPKFPTPTFIPGPIEIPVTFRGVTIPADQGDDVANPPQNGAYRNVVLKYAANGHTYIYSSDGIPIMLTGSVTFDSLPDRPKYDGQPMTSHTDIPDLSDEVQTLQAEIQALATDFSYKGSVEDYAHLPNDAEVGDVYTTTDTGVIYVWDGNAWVALNEYPPVFTGTDGTNPGTVGLVPAPAAADAGKVLGANGGWEQNGPTVVQTTGTSTGNVMSQKAVTDAIYANNNSTRIQIGDNCNASTTSTIAIGNNVTAGSEGSIALGAGVSAGGNTGWKNAIAIGNSAQSVYTGDISIGYTARAGNVYGVAVGYNAQNGGASNYTVGIGAWSQAKGNGAIALGSHSEATNQGEMNIGTSSTQTGYNSSNYRLISGVYDGQSAHDAATKGQLDSIAIKNAGAPTTATVGAKGQLLEDTTNGDLYICTAVTPQGTNPETYTYTWEEFSTTSDLAQTTGQSTTVAMSQKAVTDELYAYNDTKRIKIGAGALAGSDAVGIGFNAVGNMTSSVAIGDSALANNTYAVAIGKTAAVNGGSAVAIGKNSIADDSESIAIGSSSYAVKQGSVAIGKSAHAGGSNNAWTKGVAIGYESHAYHQNDIAIGTSAVGRGGSAIAIGNAATTNNGGGSVAIGTGADTTGQLGSVSLGAFSKTTVTGEVNVGSTTTTYGYNQSNYRIISGVYDGQSAHDVATKGQLDGLITMTDTDPGEGVTLDANHFIAYYQ